MISCCHIALALALTNICSLAIFAGYTVRLRERQFVLERKNGAEQAQLNELKKETKLLETEIAKLKATKFTLSNQERNA